MCKWGLSVLLAIQVPVQLVLIYFFLLQGAYTDGPYVISVNGAELSTIISNLNSGLIYEFKVVSFCVTKIVHKCVCVHVGACKN